MLKYMDQYKMLYIYFDTFFILHIIILKKDIVKLYK